MPRAQIFGLQLSCLPHVCIARSLALALVALRYAGPRRRPLLQHLQQIDRGSRCRRAPPARRPCMVGSVFPGVCCASRGRTMACSAASGARSSRQVQGYVRFTSPQYVRQPTLSPVAHIVPTGTWGGFVGHARLPSLCPLLLLACCPEALVVPFLASVWREAHVCSAAFLLAGGALSVGSWRSLLRPSSQTASGSSCSKPGPAAF